MLQKLSHPNVVQVRFLIYSPDCTQYLGICIDDQQNKYIVMEFLPLGSLNRLLQREKANIGIQQLHHMWEKTKIWIL